MLVLVKKMVLPHFLRKLPRSCIAIKNCIWTPGERRRSEFEIEGPFILLHASRLGPREGMAMVVH
jgi:hypothetical protein